MEDSENELLPGEHFPDGAAAPNRDDIMDELKSFGFDARGDIRLIDTTHGADDIRLNYIIDRRWVLRFCNAPEMTQTRLHELNRLIDRYNEYGLRCPRFLTDPSGGFFHERNGLCCYLQEYVDLPTAAELGEERFDEVWNEVLDSVAGFAERYRNVDLSSTFGMYSIFDLAPYDIAVGKDEKQQNFESLIAALRAHGEEELSGLLEITHCSVRTKLRSVYRELPRCVFQADENLGNVLVDGEGHVAGLIDFNNAGTEVIVNQFANLGGGFMEEVLEPVGAKTRLDHALESYRRDRERLLGIYHANELEMKALEWYTWIAWVAGWPQVCFFKAALENPALKDEICGLLKLLAEYPCP